MGNRATVIFTDGKQSFSPAVYLHRNGGPESIYAFLEELDRRGARADQDYECARFIQLVGEFFDQDAIGTLSLGVSNGPKSDKPEDLAEVMTDHGDNGFYLVNRTGKTLTMRRFFEKHVGQGYDTKDFKLVELSPSEVADERRLASLHEYQQGFKETFERLKGKVKAVQS